MNNDLREKSAYSCGIMGTQPTGVRTAGRLLNDQPLIPEGRLMTKSIPPSDSPRPIAIYGLADPDTGEIRYIGKSIRPHERLANHCNERSACHRTNWIRSVLARGKRPALIILETLPPTADWQASERRWIAHGHEQGWHLTNSTSGGDGVPDLPAEIRARIATAWIGRKHKPETLRKIGAASRQRKHDAAWRSDMSRKMQGRDFTPEWREKISRAVRKLTDEQVREVRARLNAGETQHAVAADFGVDKGTISNIKRGVCYADVE